MLSLFQNISIITIKNVHKHTLTMWINHFHIYVCVCIYGINSSIEGRAKEIAQLAKARLADVPKDVASLRMTFHRGIYLAFIKS